MGVRWSAERLSAKEQQERTFQGSACKYNHIDADGLCLRHTTTGQCVTCYPLANNRLANVIPTAFEGEDCYPAKSFRPAFRKPKGEGADQLRKTALYQSLVDSAGLEGAEFWVHLSLMAPPTDSARVNVLPTRGFYDA